MLTDCLKQDTPGYRVYMPSQSFRVQGLTARQFAEQACPGTEIRPAVDDVDSLADNRRITADIGWTPRHPVVEINVTPDNA
jgi:hypothetical protein